MAAARDEFLVKFKYWFVVGGIIILKAWGIITSFKTWLGVKPIEAAASFWPLPTPCIPALTFSAIKVAVYRVSANVNAISSGGIPNPPSNVNEVLANCFNSGKLHDKSSPPTTNQYLNLTKNSSLAAAIAYPDLVLVFAGTALMQTGKAIEIVSITMLTYLTISLTIAAVMNWYNKKIEIKEK